ncbi:MAG TPA: long-chain fatty acid--CoA ligase [Candidatus Polarisedimenticolia bacterium]|nr:long-chain fatty acid--CoA ligase [Candidatus Polarisedimenticolia bacterium]
MAGPETRGEGVEIRTLCDILTRLERRFRKPALLRYKAEGAWRDIPTEEFVSTVRALGLGLMALGVGRGDRVAILSENRPEWTAFDHALLNIGAVNVPIYPTLLTEQIRFILENSQASLLMVSSEAQFRKVEPLRAELPGLRRIVLLDAEGTPPPETLGWGEVLRRGQEAHHADPQAFERGRASLGPDDLASILYTSGTTGEPKGVMLTHGNFASNVDATLRIIPFSESDVTLSFLPLTHVFERMVEFAYLGAGATIAYAESIEAVPQNIAEIRPTVVASVPRLFEKVHARVLDGVQASSVVRRLLFALALAVGRRQARALLGGDAAPVWVRLLHPITDHLVSAKVRARMGGRLRFFISGGAPLSPAIAEFFYAMGIRVLEGYGLTETSPVIAVNRLDRARLGTVGPIVPGLAVRIAEDGEILVRGPSVMKGYFRNEAATREAIRDGWFHTGDIGRIDADGFLAITDRKKEVLKTSGGKMVAPQPIENLLKSDRFISQAVLIGDRRRFISALIAPDVAWMESYARHKGIPYASAGELRSHPRVLDLYRRRIEAKMAGHPSYEVVKKFRLLPAELTQEAGELTPTLKVKRRVVEEKYRDLIESMYEE